MNMKHGLKIFIIIFLINLSFSFFNFGGKTKESSDSKKSNSFFDKIRDKIKNASDKTKEKADEIKKNLIDAANNTGENSNENNQVNLKENTQDNTNDNKEDNTKDNTQDNTNDNKEDNTNDNKEDDSNDNKEDNTNDDNQQESNEEADDDDTFYKLLIIGDQGQFVYFKNILDKVKPMNLTKPQKIDLIFKGVEQKVDNRQCIINVNGTSYNFTNLEDKEARKIGMRNFDDLTSTKSLQDLSEKANGIVFLGDTIYPECKKLIETEGKVSSLHLQDKWNERLTCAWNIFTEHLKKIKLFQNEKLDERVDILAGNHAFDASFNKEEEILKTLKKKKENSEFYEWDPSLRKAVITKNNNPTNYFYIKKITIAIDVFNKKDNKYKRNITFVDVNTSPFVCLGWVGNQEQYENADKCGFDKIYRDRWTYVDTVNYFLAYYDVISNLDPSHWNVIRGHHPPTNYEDGDTTFYWKVFINGRNYSLMKKFEERNIRVYIGSHIHGQAVMAIPFRENPIRERGEKISAESDGAYCNLNNLKANSEELLDINNKCQTTNFELDLEKEKLMIVFINGNAGRQFDPISDGKRSARGNVVWNRRTHIMIDNEKKDAFGFSHLGFEKDKIIFSFYEEYKNEGVTDAQKVATFNVSFDKSFVEEHSNKNSFMVIGLILFVVVIAIGLGVRFFLIYKAKKSQEKNTEFQTELQA